MATVICRGEDIRFTILPYSHSFSTPIQLELIAHPSDYVLGYVSYNQISGERTFTYTESGRLIPIDDHWSLAILKEFPYVEEHGPWIVYNCSPEKTKLEFHKILSGESLHIYNWDTWSVKGKKAKVAVITSYELY